MGMLFFYGLFHQFSRFQIHSELSFLQDTYCHGSENISEICPKTLVGETNVGMWHVAGLWVMDYFAFKRSKIVTYIGSHV